MTDEFIITNLFCSIIGLDAGVAARLKDDYRFVFKAAQDKGLDLNDVKNFFHQFNYNATMRYVTKESLLPDLQLELIGLLSKTNPTLEFVEEFKDAMVTNPGFLDNPEFYSKEKFALVDKEIDALANALRNDLNHNKTM